MRSCRNSRRGHAARLGLLGVAAALVLTTPATAQNGPPIPLVPPPQQPRTGAPLNAPVPLTQPTYMVPAPLVPPSAPERQAPPTAVVPGGISAEPLAPVDAAWVGTLHDADGALPRGVWQGTARDVVTGLLPQLAPSTSPSLQDLSRRVLLSDAVSPSGDDPPDHPALLTARLDRILALGLVPEGTALIAALPQSLSDEPLDRDRIELMFAGNDVTGACRQVQTQIARYQEHWWDRALIACQALAGDATKASLGLSLLREEKAPPDPAFDTLIDALGGHPRRIERLPDPTPLRLALLAAAKQPLPADALGSASLAALHAWATNDGVPPQQRLAAAERAAQFGALAPADIAEIYAEIGNLGDAPAGPKGGRVGEEARHRAALYAAARNATSPNERATALMALAADARKRGLFPMVAQLAAPIVSDMTPDGVPDSFPLEAGRILLAAGKPGQAMSWIGVTNDPTLILIHHLATGGDTAEAPVLLHNAVAALAARDKAAAGRQADLLQALLTAFDEPTGSLADIALAAAPQQTTLPSAAVWNEQQQASLAKHVGETVLTTIILADADGRLTAEPIVLARAITGLRSVGLDAAARRLAVEAALAAGI
jgi:hypothetical protein